MKLFISYSRDDKAWVYELWRNLRDEGYHDAWIDRRLVPAVDWWATILDNVQRCECFIYVMTPKSIESIYCRSELDYAVALGKPILPLMLKPCDFPQNLTANRIQYQVITDDMDMVRVLYKIEQGISEVRLGYAHGQFPPQQADRPPVPKPQREPEHIFETFAMAEEAAAENNITLAQQLFEQVIEADPDGLGQAAKERFDEILHERDRAAAYTNVKRLADNPITVRGARAAWRVFTRSHPGYDPDGLAASLGNGPDVTQTMETATITDSAADDDETPHIGQLLALEWVDIPAGHVVLETGGYVVQEGKQWPVAAFQMTKYPITNAQYRLFVQHNGYDQPDLWPEAGWQLRQQHNWTQPRYWHDANKEAFNQDEHPVVGISWYEGVAFCEWLNRVAGCPGRVALPDEAQWQWAAAGTEGRVFPWGDDWHCTKGNNSVKPCKNKATSPVSQYEGVGDSPFGVVDLCGNVWEWCATDWANGQQVAGDGMRLLRGGSWISHDAHLFRNAFRNRSQPADRSFNCGLRVVCVWS